MKKIIVLTIMMVICATLTAQPVTVQEMVTSTDSLGNTVVVQPKITKENILEDGEIVEIVFISNYLTYVLTQTTDYRPVFVQETIQKGNLKKDFLRDYNVMRQWAVKVNKNYKLYKAYFADSPEFPAVHKAMTDFRTAVDNAIK